MRCLAILSLLLLAGCTATTLTPSSIQAPDGHTSRNSLDWAGQYRGVLPCADCPGIELQLTLTQDERYQLSTRYLERQPTASVVTGRFQWNESGNHIQLDEAGEFAYYAVGEGHLLRRYADGSWPQGEQATQLMTLRLEP